MRLPIVIMATALIWSASARAAGPDVIVSIKPLHSLVSAVMDGVGEPRLLLDGNASPHSYSLKPSDARALSQADLVFIVGGGLESFLDRPLATLGSARTVSMADAAGVQRLPLREGGLWEGHEHSHEEHHSDSPFDAHLWLNPTNAKAFLSSVAEALARSDPAHADAYRRNAEATRSSIDALDSELRPILEPVREKPYLVFHDAYHYFEDHYDLHPLGAITISPDRQPGVRRIAAIRERISSVGATCVFREPQFSPKLIEQLAGTDVRVGVLDPIGSDLPAGKEAWFTLMRRLAEAVRTCLAD